VCEFLATLGLVQRKRKKSCVKDWIDLSRTVEKCQWKLDQAQLGNGRNNERKDLKIEDLVTTNQFRKKRIDLSGERGAKKKYLTR